jgi:hypothetical protein
MIKGISLALALSSHVEEAAFYAEKVPVSDRAFHKKIQRLLSP